MTSQHTHAKPAAAKPAAKPEVRRQRTSHLVPMLVVLFALLSGLVLFVMERHSGSPAPQPNYRANYRADAPAAPQPSAPR